MTFMRKMTRHSEADTVLDVRPLAALPSGSPDPRIKEGTTIPHYNADKSLAIQLTSKTDIANASHSVISTKNDIKTLMEADSNLASELYSCILGDRLKDIGLKAGETTRHGMPRLIFLSEQPFMHPEKLTWGEHEWIRLGNNEAPRETLQLITVYKNSNDSEVTCPGYRIIGDRYALVVNIGNICIAATHMDSALTRVDTVTGILQAISKGYGLIPSAVLGDLNMCSIGLRGGIFPTREDQHTKTATIERSSASGTKHYMGGYINDKNLRLLTTRHTYGARSIIPATKLTKKLGKLLIDGYDEDLDADKEYIFSDHHSLYANYHWAEEWSLKGYGASQEVHSATATSLKSLRYSGSPDEPEPWDRVNDNATPLPTPLASATVVPSSGGAVPSLSQPMDTTIDPVASNTSQTASPRQARIRTRLSKQSMGQLARQQQAKQKRKNGIKTNRAPTFITKQPGHPRLKKRNNQDTHF